MSRGRIDARALLAEFVGTAFLLLAVVGSGIMAQRLSPNDTGLQLLESSLATALALTAMILALGAVSGTHLNPAVTLAVWSLGGISLWNAVAYVLAQVTGAVVGVVVANVSFALPAVELSEQVRSTGSVWGPEARDLRVGARHLRRRSVTEGRGSPARGGRIHRRRDPLHILD